MSPHNEQLEPTPFELARPPEPTAAQTRPQRNWIVPALAGLVLLALLVVFWLPSMVQPPAAPTPAAEPATTSTNNGNDTEASGQPAAVPAEDATPWSDAQAAKLRKEAQDVLADLLDLQFALEEQGVQQWGEDAFAAAAQRAAAGDELYKQRQYEAARAEYQQGLEQLQALMARAPEIFAEQLQLARQGLEALAPDAVASALATAALIEPTSPDLLALQQRAEQLPAVMEQLSTAQAAEQQNDLAAAKQALDQAVELDAQHQYARAEQQRIAAAYLDQQFNDAMSDGYSALDENRFEQARKDFRRAAALLPGSREAASALQEVAAAQQSSRLDRLQRRSQAAEQEEDWQQAVKAYEEALAIDGDILFARQGLQQARQRAQLDQQLRKVLDEPERLSDLAVAKDSETLLAQARDVQPRGQVLQQQIRDMEQLLQQAATPVAVTLRSDTETEVIVYKVARLGRFEQKQLTLRPGKYTAVGTRNGFRDVRRVFTIRHDETPAPILIACTEPI